MKALFLLVFIGFTFTASAQVSSDSLVKEYLAKTKEKISQKDYASANTYLKQLFALKTTLPDEVAFYYGITMVKLEYYKKGREALEKYVALKGHEGEFYNQSQELIAEANKHICQKCQNTGIAEVTDTCAICGGDGKVTTECHACNSQGIEFCSVCRGQGTRIIRGRMGDQYVTCKNCAGKGYVSCQICKGTKQRSEYCSECKGKGFFKRKVTCTH